MRPLRIGCVKYLNSRPLVFGWPTAVDFDTPASLCRKLAAGELDVALVSSFEFLEHPIYSIVDDVAVAADGAVESVLLAHKRALAETTEVALDPASRTSVNLLRCLLAESKINARFTETPTADAARLLIGDQAIRFREANADEYQIRDLSAWWKETTAVPFVFALWLVRPEVENASEIADQLRARRDANLASLDKLIASETEFTPEFCRHYFRDCLRFEFAEREKEGLLKFRSLCERHGILPPNPTPLRLV
ncbi:MAG TPA: menaquinone biosynthesis protein [Chthoniobacterales bacterium]